VDNDENNARLLTRAALYIVAGALRPLKLRSCEKIENLKMQSLFSNNLQALN
jgi:hypothetical protein